MSSLVQVIASIHRRVLLSIARAVVRAVNDDSTMQTVQAEVLKGELRNGLERFQNYGFTSVPHAGAEAAIMFVNGNRDHGIIVAIDDRRYRMKALQAGEVAIYTDEGDYIHFKRDNVIEVKTKTLNVICETATIEASEQVTLDTPLTYLTGDLSIDGKIDSTGDVSSSGHVRDSKSTMQDMRDIYNEHTHTETGSTTQVPDQDM